MYNIYEQAEPGQFTLLEEVEGETLNQTEAGATLLGYGVVSLDTPSGVYAVSLSRTGAFGPGEPMGASVQFRDLHGPNEPTPYATIEGLSVAYQVRIPFAEGERLLTLVGDFADGLVLLSLRTRD